MDLIKQLHNKTTKLVEILESKYNFLPIETSLIAYEIILITMSYHFEEKELTLKVLFSNKNFTEMGARYHLNRLIKNGWLSSEKSENDLRVKVIQPTEKLKKEFIKFLDASCV